MRLDVLTLGRCSVDLYAQQVGGRLEDAATLAKAVGGCPTNIAVGAARLGLSAGLISRVGDEAMGRFVREQLLREGVDVAGLVTDPERLTALVIQGVRAEGEYPLIFFRERCADMGLTAADADPALIGRAGALVLTGTHLSAPGPEAASRRALSLMKSQGGRVALDIDYRPNLWGLAGHGAGDSRYVAAAGVTARLRAVLPDCDLVVGTEEEFCIAGGSGNVAAALENVRSLTPALMVVKRGPMGCVAYPGALDAPVAGAGFPIEVYNVLGAGDAFMAGFLRGWLRGEPLETCCTWANACGAFAVSRLLCSPEYPTWPELSHFLAHGGERVLRRDAALNDLHRVGTRRAQAPRLLALAIDHRAQMEAMADAAGEDRARIPAFKRLAVQAAVRVAAGRPGFGMLLDGTYGRAALEDADRAGLWLARPVERPGARPLAFEPEPDLGGMLTEWPVTHTVKCLCFMHPDDPEALRDVQEERLVQVHTAARRVGRELMVEIIAGRHGLLADDTVAILLGRLYDRGVRPDWWKLEDLSAAGWMAAGEVVRSRDPHCRGIVVLGLDAPEDALMAAFDRARSEPLVRGFAVGRTIFSAAAQAWLARTLDDAGAVDAMAERFGRLVAGWGGG